MIAVWKFLRSLLLALLRPVLSRWINLPPAQFPKITIPLLHRWYQPLPPERPARRIGAVNSDQRERLVHVALGIAASALALRFVSLQLLCHERYAQKAMRQQVSEEPILARPGDILDRHGRLLATTISVPSLYVCPARIEDHEKISSQLAKALQLDQDELLNLLQRHAKKQFLWIKRRLSDDQAQAVRDLNLPERVYGFRREFQRHYPQGPLAAHILGFRDIDGLGRGGIEEALHERITGNDGVRRFVRDARGYVLDVLEEVTQPPVDGETITLTIDVLLQLHVEHELDELMKQHQPISACAIVIQPQTGEVLAMASRPAFDPNHPEKASPEAWKNMAISSVFEPGSTFKPMVVAWGLDRGVIDRNDSFHCEEGAYRMGRRVLHDHHPYGLLSLTDVLVKSSNIGMAKIGERLGNEELFAMANEFGFGRKTGIELPGELSGILHPLSRWNSYSTGSIPMGQEIAATPLQVITAHATLANHGLRITPHLVLASDSHSRFSVSMMRSQVVSAETSDWLIRGPLVDVVRRGTARRASLPNVEVFGKTGTAQKLATDGKGYSSTRNMSSFVGGAPAHDPQLLVLVSVDEPTGAEQFGGSVAGPYVAAILQHGLTILKENRTGLPATRWTENRLDGEPDRSIH